MCTASGKGRTTVSIPARVKKFRDRVAALAKDAVSGLLQRRLRTWKEMRAQEEIVKAIARELSKQESRRSRPMADSDGGR